MSLRSFARVGSSLSVFDFVHMGSSLSVRNLVRLGGDLSLVSGQALRMDNSYVKYASSSMLFYVGGSKAMTIESDGGILHGSWNTEASLVTSDRRMKKEIKPLERLDLLPRDLRPQDEEGDQAAPADPARSGAAEQHRTAKRKDHSVHANDWGRWQRWCLVVIAAATASVVLLQERCRVQ